MPETLRKYYVIFTDKSEAKRGAVG
jgi:hypothetical protein